jgi:hypothetical protein
MAVVNPYTLLVYARDATDRFVRVNLLRVVVYLVALYVLVRPESPVVAALDLAPGAPGAALGRLLLVLFPAWVYWRWTRELAGVGFYRGTWLYLAGFALMAGVQTGALAVLPAGVVGEAVAALLALTAYGVLHAQLNPASRDDVAYLGALLSPAAFLRFVRQGLGGR